MSLTEVMSEVQGLSRLDKIRLIQFLAQQLERGKCKHSEVTHAQALGGQFPWL